MELLLVPKTSSSRLLFDYVSLRDKPYGPPTPPVLPNQPGSGHLLDLFQVPAVPTDPAPNLHRILEYVPDHRPAIVRKPRRDADAVRWHEPNTTV